MAAGMDDYITKPVDRERLASVLKQWVRSPADITGDNAGAAPRPAPDAQASPFDETTAAELRDLMSSEPGGFVGLVTRFAEDTAASLATVRTALDAGDTATVGRELHTVTGTASAIGAHQLARICRHCEVQLGTDGTAIDTHEIDAIDAEFHRIVAWTRTQ